MKYVTFCQYKNNINIYETLGTLFPSSDKTFFLLNSYFGQLSISKVNDDFDFSNLTEESIDFFDIKISQKAIHISIPLKNSSYQYNTLFSDYFQASEYVESRFLDFIEEKKMI